MINEERRALINQLRKTVDQWYLAHSKGNNIMKLTEEYNQYLAQLYATGWTYSLYLVNEIPVEYLPEFYLKRTKEISYNCFQLLLDQLHIYVEGHNEQNPVKETAAVKMYYQIVKENFKIGHDEDHELFIDRDTMLVNEDMPDFYMQDFIRKGVNIYDREHQINITDSRRVRTIGLSQLTGEEPEE